MYEKYRLNANPFEIAPVTYQMAGREREWKNILNRLQAAFQGSACRFIVIIGDYGLGKTFTVEKLYREIKARKEELRTIVVRTKTLAGRPIRASPAEPSSTKFGLDFITRIFDNLQLEQMQEIAQKASPKGQNQWARLFGAVAKGNQIAFSLLAGHEVQAKLVQQQGFEVLKTSEQAKQAFYEFLALLKKAGYENLLIILDEFEYVMTLTPGKITVILQTLREIFDEYAVSVGQMAKVVILFTVSPGGWDKLSDLETSEIKRTGGAGIVPFRQRIDPRDMIPLPPLSAADIEDMFVARLDAHRTAKVSNKLTPFTKESVKVIRDVTGGVPRKALMFASILLDDALEHEKEDITQADAKRALGQLNLIPLEAKQVSKPKRRSRGASRE